MTDKSTQIQPLTSDKTVAAPSDTTTLSVIVPVHNSVHMLKRCLDALAQSEYKGFEVLVIDDGSTEPIEPIVSEYGHRYMRIEGPNGPGVARNHAAKHVSGTHLVFVDADVCIHSDTLGRFAAVFDADPGVASVIGTYDDEPDDPNFVSQYKNLFHHYVHQDSDGPVTTFWAGCGAMRRDVFLQFGGFDEQRYRRPSIEDIDLGARISEAGHRIVLDQSIRCKHLKRWTLTNLIKTDVFDRGIPWTRLMLRSGAINQTLNTKWSQRVSVVLVYLTIITTVAAICWPGLWLVAAAMAVLVTLINFDFYRYFAARRGLWFTLRTVPMHWLYFFYCGVCILVGTIQHRLARDSDGHATNTG